MFRLRRLLLVLATSVLPAACSADSAKPPGNGQVLPGSSGRDDPGAIGGGGSAAASGAGGTTDVAGTAGAGGAEDALTSSGEALQRILPDHYREFVVNEELESTAGDRFRIAALDERILIEGTSPAVVLTGVGWYLKYVARVDLGWPGSSLSKLPAVLPLPDREILVEASVPHRFALNDTDDGYSGPYRDWAEWERTIDLLALNGYNEVLVTVGQDSVYQATFEELGYSASELEAWIPAPAHQPWWLMQNMCCVGAPLSKKVMKARLELGRRIVERLGQLGMTAVLPGYFGTVPPDFPKKKPGAVVVPQGIWTGSVPRPDWLDSTSDSFSDVAAAFYSHQAELLGTTTMYKMDLLHEGGTAGSVPVPDAAAGVMSALQHARPGATWVLLGWQNNPKVELLDAVDKSHVLIVDGLSDTSAGVDRESRWNGTPYAFGTIPNFGGHTTLGANASTWLKRFEEWRTKANSLLTGIAYMPEGAGTDPAAFELFSELAWRKEAMDPKQWFADYATRRYGGEDDHAQAAWEALRATVYSTSSSGTDSDAQDSLFAARPSLTATKAAMWSPTKMRYDGAALEPALYHLLQVPEALRSSDAYRFDLVNVARQVLTNESRILLPQIANAHSAADLETFRALVREWQADLDQLDAIAATDPRFLLGRWLAAARSWESEPAQQDLLETNARFIITLWYPTATASSQLRDYANREWSGLIRDFYARRWLEYFTSLDSALASGTPPTPIDWYAIESEWVSSHANYPTEPVGDPFVVASEIGERLAALLSQRIYEMRPRDSGLCVDAAKGGVENGTAIQQWTCNASDAQRFRAEARGAGYFRFVNVKSSKCLDVTASATEGSRLQLWTCNGTDAQDFALQEAGAGHHVLVSRKSGHCVRIESGVPGPGAGLMLVSCGDPANGSFSFH